MQSAPLRLLVSLRPDIPAGVLAATAVSTVVFSATPFLIRGVAVDQHVAVGTVGIISTAQLGGFTLASWGGGRVVRASRGVLLAAVLLGMVANVVSAFTPWFSMLVAIRFVSGLSLGLIAWIAWTEVFGDDERVGDVAVIGPVVGTISSPIVASVMDAAGPPAVFLGLAALHLVPLAFVRRTRLQATERPHHDRHRPTRAAGAILACLCLTTLGGSAVFIFVAVIGQDLVGLDPLLVSLAFSANALAGVPSARFRGTRRMSGLWLAVTGVSALLIAVVHVPAVFWIGLPLWGFAFWMGIPGVFALLAERSAYPEERAGDAQAVMAGGRVIGPLVGGALYTASPVALGVVGGGCMLLAGIALVYVEWRVHPRAPPARLALL
ncbi:MAG: MFS transporter [Ilumatobacteraceae bacterium]